MEIGFSPNQQSTQRIVRLIEEAQISIRGAAYSFTSAPIAKAIVDAHQRGIDVKMVLDRSQRRARYSSYRFLSNAGVPVRINARYSIMHNKYLVIDGRHVQLGSFNYTKAAEQKNAENVLIMRNAPKEARLYLKNWERLWGESE